MWLTRKLSKPCFVSIVYLPSRRIPKIYLLERITVLIFINFTVAWVQCHPCNSLLAIAFWIPPLFWEPIDQTALSSAYQRKLDLFAGILLLVWQPLEDQHIYPTTWTRRQMWKGSALRPSCWVREAAGRNLHWESTTRISMVFQNTRLSVNHLYPSERLFVSPKDAAHVLLKQLGVKIGHSTSSFGRNERVCRTSHRQSLKLVNC